MDAKDLRTESALGDRSNDGNTKYPQGNALLQCNRNKPYQDIGSNSLAKVDVQTSRPCAVIGPDRVVPPPASTDAYIKKGPAEPWLGADNIYRRPPEYPHKIGDYHHQTRNISPRQTFQENMQRIMVPPSFNSVKLKEDHNFPVDPIIAPLRNKSNMPNEVKYCEVPYAVNPLINEQKSIRNTDISVSNMNPSLARNASAPQGWPPGSANVRPSKPYSAPELYPYPEYSSCAGPRPMLMPRTHRTIQEEPGHVYTDPYYHDGSIRFKPYPAQVKERYPQPRYEYVGNYSNPFQPPPPFPSHKYDLQKPVPPHPYPGYSQVPLKYLEPRMVEPIMNGYQRPLNQQTNFNAVPFRNQVIHPTYGPVPGNCLQANKFYPYPPDNTKPITSNKMPYDINNKMYPEYENTRPKPYPLPDSFYVNEVSRSHPMKGQVLPPSYSSVNLHPMPPYPYYRKENPTMKNYEFSPHYRNIDPSVNINVNSLSRLPSQFSPNAIAISPSDSNTSNDTSQTQATAQEDCGYVSQSSSTSIRSMDSGINRTPHDFYRRYDYRYGPIIKASPLLSRPEGHPNSNIGSKNNKREIDVRQFLQMWNETEDENGENNNKENTTKAISVNDITNHFEAAANQEQLYVLGLVNVPSEELSKYEHIQKVSKLPENIKGYNSIELLNQFEEVIESSNLNKFNIKMPTQRDFHVSLKSSMLHEISIPQRPISPLDVEAKISQSVIHKEVGCNFEIRPCSPKMLNVDVATPVQNLLGERVIEKVSNPLILSSPLGSVGESMDTCNVVKHQEHITSSNENKASSCKMNSTQYDPAVSVKTNYSLQDLESNSGVCLASLPRLDNDIELNFPEVNQQFINANKVESVITSTPKDLPTLDMDQSNIVKDRKEQEIEVDQFSPNIEFEKEFAKLSKYRKIKRKGSESKENIPEPNAQAMRTDSVIIKNPENKNQEESLESCVAVKNLVQDADQNPINLTVQERMNDIRTDTVVNKTIKGTEDSDMAIDFSLNSNDQVGAKNSFQDHKANLSFSDDLYIPVEKHCNIPCMNYSSEDSDKIKISTNVTQSHEDSDNVPNGIAEHNESSKCVEGITFESDPQTKSDTECDDKTVSSPSNVIIESVKPVKDLNLVLDNSKREAENLLHNTTSIECLNEVCLINDDSSCLNDILRSSYCVSVATESVLSNVSNEEDNLFTNRKLKGKLEINCNEHLLNEYCSGMTTETTTISNKDISETEKMQTKSCEIEEIMDNMCTKNEATTCLSEILYHVNKELFSPWIQKLILYNEGLCTRFLHNKVDSEELVETSEKTTTSCIDSITADDTIESLVKTLGTDCDDQDMAENITTCALDVGSGNIKTDGNSSVLMSDDNKDDSGIDETIIIKDTTCKQKLENTDARAVEGMIVDNNEMYDSVSNNTKRDGNIHIKVNTNVCDEIGDVFKETNEIISKTTPTCLNTAIFDSNGDIDTTSKLIMETDLCDNDTEINYSCSLSKTPENNLLTEDVVNDNNTTQKLIKSTGTNHTSVDVTTNISILEVTETDSCLPDPLFDSVTNKSISNQDNSFKNSILNSTYSDFCAKDMTIDNTRDIASEIRENDLFGHNKEGVGSMSVKPTSKTTKTDSCAVAKAFNNSPSDPNSQSSKTEDCTAKSVVNLTESNTDDAQSDPISESTEIVSINKDAIIESSINGKKDLETTAADSYGDDKTINFPNQLISKPSKNYFSIDTVADNSTQEQLNSKSTNAINTSIDLILNTEDDQSCIEDTFANNTTWTLVSKTTEIDAFVNETTNRSEAIETHSFSVHTKFINAKDHVILKDNPSVVGMAVDNTTKELVSRTTEIDQIVDDTVVENEENVEMESEDSMSTTLNSNSCFDGSPTTIPIVDQIVSENTTVKLEMDATQAYKDTIISKPSLIVSRSVLCSTEDDVAISNTREPVSQLLDADNCNENITGEENENIRDISSDLQNIHSNKTVELNSNHNTCDSIAELSKFSPDDDSSICQIRYEELEAELDSNSSIQSINVYDAQRHLFPFINDTDSELKCVVNLKDVSNYRCEESDTKVINKLEDVAKEVTIDKKHENFTDNENDSTNASTHDENIYNATFDTPQELLEYCSLKQSEIDTCDAIPLNKSQLCDPFKYMRYRNNRSLAKKRGTLKRSLSDSALDTYNIDLNDSKQEVSENRPLLWPNKRKKVIESEGHFITESYCNIIHHNRRNSISAMYNEENVSFCILIDDNCIITEEDETDKICFTDIPEDCLTCINDATNLDENTDTEMSPNEEINCEYSNSFALNCEEDKGLEETWVEDVACVETVVSDDIAEDIIVSASTSPKETDLSDDECNTNETSIFDVSDHTDKVKYIYGDKMCSNDAQLLETLYRTPQMDVNKTLVYKESHVAVDCGRYYDEQTLEEVLSESNTFKTTSSKLSDSNSPQYSPDTIKARKNKLDAKDNLDSDNLKSCLSSQECKKNCSNIVLDLESEKNEQDNVHTVVETQDDTVHSCESSVDNVFSYNQPEETPMYTLSSSPEVSSTTTEEKNASILLKITNYKGSRIAQVSDNSNSKRNTVCCKYTENKEYINFNTNLPSRPLLTKAAQKYIPPLRETIRDLKVKLPLPPHSLIKLKQLKISKEEPKQNVKINNVNIGRKEIPKKTKPKFEDVLKSIDEIQFQKHKEKSKKIKKPVPKVVIKKNENGSHYASTSGKDIYNPDLTGRKWQPWVFLERNHFVDKMALGKKTKAIFNHRKNKFVLAETFKKYRSIASTKFIISQPKTDDSSLGQLKYTIRLKHSY